MNVKRELELKEDFDSGNRHPVLKTSFKMEKQMALIYTSHNFTTFQEEILKSIDYNVRSLDQSENQRLIKVYLHGETEHQRDVGFMSTTKMCKCQC